MTRRERARAARSLRQTMDATARMRAAALASSSPETSHHPAASERRRSVTPSGLRVAE